MNTSLLQVPFFTATGIHYMPVEKIIRCKAISNYTCFYTKEKKKVTAKCLGAYDEQLQQFGFVRTNRGNLLNINFIKNIQYNYLIELLDCSFLKISRRRRKDFSALSV